MLVGWYNYCYRATEPNYYFVDLCHMWCVMYCVSIVLIMIVVCQWHFARCSLAILPDSTLARVVFLSVCHTREEFLPLLTGEGLEANLQ